MYALVYRLWFNWALWYECGKWYGWYSINFRLYFLLCTCLMGVDSNKIAFAYLQTSLSMNQYLLQLLFFWSIIAKIANTTPGLYGTTFNSQFQRLLKKDIYCNWQLVKSNYSSGSHWNQNEINISLKFVKNLLYSKGKI